MLQVPSFAKFTRNLGRDKDSSTPHMKYLGISSGELLIVIPSSDVRSPQSMQNRNLYIYFYLQR